MSPQKFKQKLQDNNVPITNHLSILMRRVNAGDSKVTYHEFGKEIFKNYKDSNDATHFARGETLQPHQLTQRAQSPEVRPNRRFDNRPKDNLSTSARVVGIAPYEGIKTDLDVKPRDSIEVYGKIREKKTDKVYSEDYPRNIMTSATITTKYVPKKGNFGVVQKVHQSQSTIDNTINQEKALASNAHEEYLQSFKHAKDIRDQVNSEQNIITWKK